MPPRDRQNDAISLYVSGFKDSTRPSDLANLFEPHGRIADGMSPSFNALAFDFAGNLSTSTLAFPEDSLTSSTVCLSAVVEFVMVMKGAGYRRLSDSGEVDI
ncbi:hypothetical protein BGX33_011460 [Mortierella sp. NVP41]|nr:hypothetical protein BGX33_011460 [Mortierella sp. NVP41]